MKNFLIICLLGLGMLMPTNNVSAAKEFTTKKVIDIGIEQFVLTAHSQTSDGPILTMTVKTVPGGVIVAQQDCGDYTCSMDISGLPAGNYVVKVCCTYRTAEKQFKK